MHMRRASYGNAPPLNRGDRGGSHGVGAESRLPALTNFPHTQALETAAQFGISAYDARFIALAKELRVKLVTEDTKLLTAVPSLTRSLAEAID
jgi:predicted nucleic acid-binding protein